MTDFYAFDRNSAQELVRMYHKLRSQVERLQKQLITPQAGRKSDWGRLLRTGVTTTSDDFSVYPAKSNGDTFVVRLQTWTFPETTGHTAVTRVDWDQYVIARTVDGSWLPEGSHVQVFRQQGRGGRRWWIEPDNGKSDVIAVLAEDVECERRMVAIDPDTSYEIRTGKEIDVSEAYNQYDIRALDDDVALLKWDAKYQRYFIAQVQHRCLSALVDVWDTEGCLMKIGACLSAPGVRKPEAGDPGCKIFDWTECASSSAALTCDDIWPGTACGECPPSSSGGG